MKFIAFIVGAALNLIVVDAMADAPLQIIGVYKDNSSKLGMFPELILYTQDGKVSGVFSDGYPHATYGNGLYFGISPMEDISLTANGILTFRVPQSEGNQQSGFRKKYRSFEGKFQNDIIQGATYDEYGYGEKSIKAIKETAGELKQDIFEYVLNKKRIALENISRLNEVLACQNKRNKLPAEGVEILGFWTEYGSDGQREWGYDVVLFKIGNEFHGWLEDYEGFIGDGGIRNLIKDIHLNEGKLNFKVRNIEGRELDGKNPQLEMKVSGKITRLEKVESPEIDRVWKAYQALNVKCE